MSDGNLLEVTAKLGKAYSAWKAKEAEKEKYRKEFFEAGTEQNVASRTLAKRTVVIPPAEHDNVDIYLETYYPKWRVEGVHRQVDIGRKVNDLVATLVEDPKYLGFEITNPEDGKVYTQQVVDGSPRFDADRFKRDHPDKWNKVTQQAERQLKPLDKLTGPQLELVSKYFVPGKPTLKLAPPKEASEEDLDDE